MDTILNKLGKTRKQLVKKAEDRDEYYKNRTEVWQDSEKGIGYEVDTMLISDIVHNLDKVIEDTKLFLKN